MKCEVPPTKEAGARTANPAIRSLGPHRSPMRSPGGYGRAVLK